jgi:hypothetical protein
MFDRHLFVRLGVAVVAVGLLVGGFVLLTGKDEPPTANDRRCRRRGGRADVRPASAHAAPQQPARARAGPIARPTSGRSSTS